MMKPTVVVSFFVIGVVQLPHILRAQSWAPTGAPSTNWVALAESSDGATVFAAVGGLTMPAGPILISTNSAGSWTPSSAPVTNWTRVVCSANGVVAYASAESMMYRSTNSGITWEALNLSPTYSGTWESLACSADGRIILAAHNFPGLNGWLTEIFVSTNHGSSWSDNLFKGDNVVAAAMSANGRQMVCSDVVSPDGAGQSAGMVISTNMGVAWVRAYPPFWAPSLVCSADGAILAGALGSVVISTNSASTWEFTFGAGAPSFPAAIACSVDGNQLVTVGQQIWTSKDTGITWSRAPLPPGPPYLTNWNAVASSADGSKLYASIRGGGIYTWQASSSPVLHVGFLNSSITLSWMVPSAAFVLEQVSDLTSGNWKPVPTTPSLNYSTLRYEASILKPQGTIFYRLASQ